MYLVLCTMVLFFIKAPYKPSYSRLESMWPITACTKFLIGYRLLVDSGLLKKDRIPDISKISKFLESKTGFRLRPASGLCPKTHWDIKMDYDMDFIKMSYSLQKQTAHTSDHISNVFYLIKHYTTYFI